MDVTADPPNTGRTSAPSRVVGLIAGLAIATVALNVGFFDHAPTVHEDRHQLAWAIALGLFFAFSDRLLFHVEARREAVSYSPSDVGLGLGLIFLDPLTLIVVRLIGSSAGHLFWRRNEPLKWSFNAVNFAFECTVASIVFRAFVPEQPIATLFTWFALLVALTTAVVLAGLAVAAVISCFEGGFLRRARSELLNAPVFHLPGAALGAAIASSTLAAPWIGVVTASLVPILWLMVRAHGALLHRYSDLTSAHRFSEEVGDGVDLSATLRAASHQIADNLRAGSVAVRVWDHQGELVDASVGADALLESLPVHRSATYQVTTDLSAAAEHDSVTLRLEDDRGVLGLVAIADREGVNEAFDHDDLARAQTMAQQLTVTVRKGQLHRQIQFDATHDRLTGLANRQYFQAWVDEAPTDRPSSVLFIDLDRFKEINDAFGHHAGDRLLELTAARIAETVPEDCVTARFGGDEFAIFAPDHDVVQAKRLADKIADALDEPFLLIEASVTISCSIGIVTSPQHGTGSTLLLRRADLAMYEAKRKYKRWAAYDEDLNDDDLGRLALLSDLRQALLDHELDVHFQPKIDICSGEVVAAEALVRWTHAERGPVRPDIFVELAEQAGLIEPLTRVVLDKSLAAAAIWQRRDWDISVAVNISAQSLLDERLVKMVRESLEFHGLSGDRLILEITESTMMVDPERTERMLERLTEIGVEIAVDDFGTGFSSLSSLRQLPVSEIKIDRGFVSAMDTSHHDAVIVRSTIDLAHNLGLRIVAEGVETPDILNELGSLDCDLAQGFGISRPLPLIPFNDWIMQRIIKGRRPTWEWSISGLIASPPVEDVAPTRPTSDGSQRASNIAKSSSKAFI